MVQYDRIRYRRERAEHKSHISQSGLILQTNLIFFYGRCKVVHYADFLQDRQGQLHHFKT